MKLLIVEDEKKTGEYLTLMNPLMIFIKIIKLR